MFCLARNGEFLCKFPARRAAWPLRQMAAIVQKSHLTAKTPTAKKLLDTGLYRPSHSKKPKAKVKGDRTRVNIVSEKLCSKHSAFRTVQLAPSSLGTDATNDIGDVVDYMKPSLQRHIGCDMIDLYPGVGLFSKKLHDAVKPRSHILMEPDADFYQPFLQPLLKKPETTVVKKSGIVWSDLNDILNPTYLPNQVERPAKALEAPERNDSLLVVANLAFYPKKRFQTFASVAGLVLFQFIASISAASLFQKYGLVRMLLWVSPEDTHAVLPRSVQRRRRAGVVADLSTEYIAEVACPSMGQSWYKRETNLDLESAQRALARMEEDGVVIPRGRESDMVQAIRNGRKKTSEAAQVSVASKTPEGARIARPYLEELSRLEQDFDSGKFDVGSEKHARMKQLEYRAGRATRFSGAISKLLAERDALSEAYETGTPLSAEAKHREEAWNKTIESMPRTNRLEFNSIRDNLHVVAQDPRVMSWDRRPIEPLTVQDDEFMPHIPCCLLDLQPKAMHPALRSSGPGSDRSGDIFEMLVQGMMQLGAEPVSKAIESVWPGAAAAVLPNCPSLRDRSKAGIPVPGPSAELVPRILNETQWMEILAAWMQWPFRPSYLEMVARAGDDGAGDNAEEDGNHHVFELT